MRRNREGEGSHQHKRVRSNKCIRMSTNETRRWHTDERASFDRTSRPSRQTTSAWCIMGLGSVRRTCINRCGNLAMPLAFWASTASLPMNPSGFSKSAVKPKPTSCRHRKQGHTHVANQVITPIEKSQQQLTVVTNIQHTDQKKVMRERPRVRSPAATYQQGIGVVHVMSVITVTLLHAATGQGFQTL
jgi:hypothetical protein